MKVLDIQCGHQHVFEGWFASEDDFLSQQGRGLVECPVCGDASITKRLSAPRLNLGAARGETSSTQEVVATATADQTLPTAWMAVARRILANTDDVGNKFAEEARKIHYGEAKERGIRGQASRAETESLIEEGIAVMALPLPEALKGQLQ
ncbi:MAG: DUF1178 family protein [Rhodoferax sp.]|uniref:DUF1178 family protein n=1 Tax=Rhodoferax sp. TaxID=50421 RepID=UPI00271F276D|nr:DUF1178 family protein [Rhodoferax sp.]MDO8450951.1 DUF1178 family protein [Rhodoferax sp.]